MERQGRQKWAQLVRRQSKDAPPAARDALASPSQTKTPTVCPDCKGPLVANARCYCGWRPGMRPLRPVLRDPPGGYIRDPRHPNQNIFVPSSRPPGDLCRLRQRELCERVQLYGIPTPREYTAWYEENRVAETSEARDAGLCFCPVCGALVEDSEGNLVLDDYLDPPGQGRRPKPGYCSKACKARAKSRRVYRRAPDDRRLINARSLVRSMSPDDRSILRDSMPQ